MLGSCLTLNRTLTTSYIASAAANLNHFPPPRLAVRSWLFDFDIAHPFLLSSRTSHDDLGLQWSSTILLLDAFAKTRRRLARGSRRRAWTRVYVGLVCFTFATRHLFVVCTQTCIFRCCIVLRHLYAVCMRCCILVSVML